MRAAHEPLVRFFEPLSVGPLSPKAAEDAVVKPLQRANVDFDQEVVNDIVRLSAGRPYYLDEALEQPIADEVPHSMRHRSPLSGPPLGSARPATQTGPRDLRFSRNGRCAHTAV